MMIDKLYNAELKNKVEDITYEKFPIWSFLRNNLGWKLLLSKSNSVNNTENIIKILIKNLKNMFYGFFNIFKNTEVIILGISEERRILNDVYISKNNEFIGKFFKNSLFIEEPYNNNLYPINKLNNNRVISMSLIYILANIYKRIFLRKKNIINNYIILEELKSELDISFTFDEILRDSKSIYSIYFIMKLFFKLKRPKYVFTSCYVCHLSIIKAAKDLGITVIEIQHGSLHEQQFPYVVKKRLEDNCYPDYYFAFGFNDKNFFSKNITLFLNKDNVFPIGNNYINIIANKTSFDEKLLSIKKDFKYTIGFSSSGKFMKEELEFLNQVAKKDTKILYIFIHRQKDTNSDFNFDQYLLDNLIIVDWLNCYEIILHCNFHSTMMSTCAIEAPSIGLQNILFNYNNYSKGFFGETLVNENITRYADDVNEYIDAIYSIPELDKKSIKQSNVDIINDNYENNFINAIKTIESDING